MTELFGYWKWSLPPCVMCSLEILIQLVRTNVLINLWWQCKVSKQLCMYPEQTYSLSETGPVCRYCCLKILTCMFPDFHCNPCWNWKHGFTVPSAHSLETFFKGNRIQSSVYSSQWFLLGQKIHTCNDLCQYGCKPHMMRLKPILFFSVTVLGLTCGFMTK